MDILSLSAILQKNPELCSVFNYKAVQQYIMYIDLINLLRPKLRTLQPSYQHGPPPTIPVSVHEFLKQCFSMSDYMGKLSWESFRLFAWSTPFTDHTEEQAAVGRYVKLFLLHGISHNIGGQRRLSIIAKKLIAVTLGVYNLEAPTQVCIDDRCCKALRSNPNIIRDLELVEESTHKITIFTKDLGAIPAFSVSRYCRSTYNQTLPSLTC